jgi:hypothetical protein
MYPHFIEVTYREIPFLVNIDRIEAVYDGKIVIGGSDAESYYVNESYTELKELIRSAGCAIRKADPRLDDRMPLGMEDLCRLEMVGQPVWNSNAREWMLVIDSALDNRSWVDLIDASGKPIRYGPHEVVKFPLYRMKREPCS